MAAAQSSQSLEDILMSLANSPEIPAGQEATTQPVEDSSAPITQELTNDAEQVIQSADSFVTPDESPVVVADSSGSVPIGIQPKRRVITNIPSEIMKLDNDGTMRLIKNESKPTRFGGELGDSSTAPVTGKIIPITKVGDITSSLIDTASKDISSQISGLASAKTIEDRVQQSLQIDKTFTETVAKAQSAARQLAEQNLGLPVIEQQLKASEARDHMHPLWKKYMTDSNETAQIRARLQTTELKVETLANRYIKENGPLNAMASSVKNAKALVDVYNRKDQMKQDALDRVEAGAAARKEVKDQAAIDKAETVYAMLPPDVKNDLAKILPNSFGNPDILVQGKTVDIGLKTKEVAPILRGEIQPDKYLQFGIEANSNIGLALAANRQAEQTGIPFNVVRSQVAALDQFVKNPAIAAEKIKNYGSSVLSPEELKAYNMVSTMQDKASQTSAMKMRASMVDRIATEMNKRAVMSDIKNWPIAPGQPSLYSLPESKDIFDKVRTATGKDPDILTFSKMFVGDPNISRDESLRRSKLVKDSYGAAIESYNNGIYGNKLDTIKMVNQAVVAAATSTMGRIGEKIGSMLNNRIENIASPLNFPVGTGIAYSKAIAGGASDLYKGIISGSNQ
jgi:hypothetical protein